MTGDTGNGAEKAIEEEEEEDEEEDFLPRPDRLESLQRYKIATGLNLWRLCEFESATGSVLSAHRYGSAGWKVTKVTTSKSPCVLWADPCYCATNAEGFLTNQLALILSQQYNTNTREFTTNYFQVFDVPLTNGSNTVTLRASDAAGNIATTNLTVSLDYSGKTNPPAIALYWPRATTRVSGASFTWRGHVDDQTVGVSAQWVDTNFVTNVLNGRVGRNGDFHIDNVPLLPGTNSFTVVERDAAGNMASTNVSVRTAETELTISAASWSEASGTISDPNYTVWVNGAEAVLDGEGGWTAEVLPTFDNPILQARAIPTAEGTNGTRSASVDQGNPASTTGCDTETELARPDGDIFTTSDNFRFYQSWVYPPPNTATSIEDDTLNWSESGGGQETYTVGTTENPDSIRYDWGSASLPQFPDGVLTFLRDGSTTDGGWPISTIHPNIAFHYDLDYSGPYEHFVRQWNEDKTLTLVTGGDDGSTEPLLYCISGGAVKHYYPGSPPELHPSGEWVDVPPEQIVVGGLGNLDTNGFLFVNLPAHAQLDITPSLGSGNGGAGNAAAPGGGGSPSGTAGHEIWLAAELKRIVPKTDATTPLNRKRTTVGVGEVVEFSLEPTIQGGFAGKWYCSAGSLFPTNRLGVTIKWTAPSNAMEEVMIKCGVENGKMRLRRIDGQRIGGNRV